jgi:hypothetical protein
VFATAISPSRTSSTGREFHPCRPATGAAPSGFGSGYGGRVAACPRQQRASAGGCCAPDSAGGGTWGEFASVGGLAPTSRTSVDLSVVHGTQRELTVRALAVGGSVYAGPVPEHRRADSATSPLWMRRRVWPRPGIKRRSRVVVLKVVSSTVCGRELPQYRRTGTIPGSGAGRIDGAATAGIESWPGSFWVVVWTGRLHGIYRGGSVWVDPRNNVAAVDALPLRTTWNRTPAGCGVVSSGTVRGGSSDRRRAAPEPNRGAEWFGVATSGTPTQ